MNKKTVRGPKIITIKLSPTVKNYADHSEVKRNEVACVKGTTPTG